MRKWAYYNDSDSFAAAWLRELIKAGQIAPGEVDERSVLDVGPHEVKGFTQCHFFAGIGVWSHALRLAGWVDDRPVWTGSCPCQPFSASGRGQGFDDERHLWPHWHHLIAECRPAVVLGEQVASKDGLAWLDLVQADMEATGYACGAVDLCAAGVGAPHIRQRLWIVGKRLEQPKGDGRRERRPEPGGWSFGARRGPDGLADAVRGRAGNRPGQGLGTQAATDGRDGHLPGQRLRAGQQGASGRVVDGERPRLEGHAGDGHAGGEPGWFGSPSRRSIAEAGRARGLADASRGGAGTISGAQGEGEGQRRATRRVVDQPVAGVDDGRLADADQGGRQVVAASRLSRGWPGAGSGEPGEGNADRASRHDADRCGEHGRLADAESGAAGARLRDQGSTGEGRLLAGDDDADGGLADAAGPGRSGGPLGDGGADGRPAAESGRLRDAGGLANGGGQFQEPVGGRDRGDGSGSDGADDGGSTERPGPVNGYWRAADWLQCRDGKWRPVEPGTLPLVAGLAGRVGLLRGYGNSINAPLAQAFIESVMDVLDG